ncbi:MAG: hypothetical protein EXS58_03495 [Candidatus Latescibacteria bacterium]|nr:hypothetical protein [Candidatus Latescibacterota bacterium]
MNPEHEHRPSDDKMLTGVEAALRRARQRALEIAARTGTPIVTYRNGKIEMRPVAQGETPK